MGVSDPDPDPDLTVTLTLHTAEELLTDINTAQQILDLINDCYYRHPNFDTIPRFTDVADFAKAIGKQGFCSVIWMREDYQDKPIASASLRCFVPRDHLLEQLKKDLPNMSRPDEIYTDFEPIAVVSKKGSEYRGKGYAMRCTAALEQRSQTIAEGRTSPSGQKTKVRYWAQTAEEPNGSYWRRRGYLQVGPSETKPVGMWGARKEFDFTTLVKSI